MPTKIQWCDETLNIVTGCTKISAGCKNCFAEGMIKRFGHNRDGSENDKIFNRIVLHPDRLQTPAKWKKPKSIFLCSMGDLFHPDIDANFIYRVMGMMGSLPRHTFLLLTKRPDRIPNYLTLIQESFTPNVWLGVSVSTQGDADSLIPILLQIPAAKHFVSVEPMLEEINLIDYLPLLSWVICGCESGPKRRPSDINWFRNLLDQCRYIDPPAVPFFLKQAEFNGKIVKMPSLDGQVWSEKPKIAEDRHQSNQKTIQEIVKGAIDNPIIPTKKKE